MYLRDPKTNKKSVTLTFLVLSFVAFLVIAILAATDHVQETNSLAELFYACAALYFGRRVKVNGKTFAMNQDGQEKEEDDA